LPNAGIFPDEQPTPGVFRRIRLTDDVTARFNGDGGEGFIAAAGRLRALDASRQTAPSRALDARDERPMKRADGSPRGQGVGNLASSSMMMGASGAVLLSAAHGEHCPQAALEDVP
jgi:hypothetical protein